MGFLDLFRGSPSVASFRFAWGSPHCHIAFDHPTGTPQADDTLIVCYLSFTASYLSRVDEDQWLPTLEYLSGNDDTDFPTSLATLYTRLYELFTPLQQAAVDVFFDDVEFPTSYTYEPFDGNVWNAVMFTLYRNDFADLKASKGMDLLYLPFTLIAFYHHVHHHLSSDAARYNLLQATQSLSLSYDPDTIGRLGFPNRTPREILAAVRASV